MHPAVLSSGRHASVMRDVGSLVAQISVPGHSVYPLWIRYCCCVSWALSSFAIHLNHSYRVINRFGNMSLRTGSVLALLCGTAVLNIVRLTKVWQTRRSWIVYLWRFVATLLRAKLGQIIWKNVVWI